MVDRLFNVMNDTISLDCKKIRDGYIKNICRSTGRIEYYDAIIPDGTEETILIGTGTLIKIGDRYAVLTSSEIGRRMMSICRIMYFNTGMEFKNPETYHNRVRIGSKLRSDDKICIFLISRDDEKFVNNIPCMDYDKREIIKTTDESLSPAQCFSIGYSHDTGYKQFVMSSCKNNCKLFLGALIFAVYDNPISIDVV